MFVYSDSLRVNIIQCWHCLLNWQVQRNKISNVGWVKSLVDDLYMERGTVSMRVDLFYDLLRFSPCFGDLCKDPLRLIWLHSYHFPSPPNIKSSPNNKQTNKPPTETKASGRWNSPGIHLPKSCFRLLMPWSRFLFAETYPPGRQNKPSPQPLPYNKWYPLHTI